MRFGEFLVNKGIASVGSINHALEYQRLTANVKAIDRRYRKLGNILLLICAVREEELAKAFEEFSGKKEGYVATSKYKNSIDNIEILSMTEYEETECVILSVNHSRRQILVGAMTDQESLKMRMRLLLNKAMSGYAVVIKSILELPYKQWIKQSYEMLGRKYNPAELQVAVDEKMKTAFRYAIEKNATDISIESEQDATYVFMTIDKERSQFSNIIMTNEEAEEASNWIITKSGTGMTLASQQVVDCALPTLGDIRTHRARVNKISTYHGVTINLRILPNKPSFIDLETLSYSNYINTYMKFLAKPRKGLVLIVGPTNSGKNTSVFAILTDILKKYKNKIISLEQPVEYLVPGVQQINATSDKDYAEIARALVRQSPDIIYLSEIRDHITMDTALNVSNTGKFVLSTLHVSNAYDVFNRAEAVYGKDISMKLMSELTGVVNQVLVPRACPKCLIQRSLDSLEPEYQKVLVDKQYRGMIYDNTGRVGDKICSYCEGNGYKGIIPIAEFINFDANLKRKLRMAQSPGDRDSILISEMEQNENSILFDAFKNMANQKVSISTLINKSILDAGFSEEGEKKYG